MGLKHIISGLTAERHLASINAGPPRDSNRVKRADFRILDCIMGLAAHFNKSHCYPTQAKLLALLEKLYGLVISRRTLNHHLRRLEDDQWLRRIRRHMRDKRKGFVMRSTCYVPMWRACRRAARSAAAIFSLIGTQAGPLASIRVTQTAQYLKRSINRLSLTP